MDNTYAVVDETHTIPKRSKKKVCRNHANTLTLLLEKHEGNPASGGARLDDGVALRMIVDGEGEGQRAGGENRLLPCRRVRIRSTA